MTGLGRYHPRNLLKTVRNPHLALLELRRVSSLLNTRYHRMFPHNGFEVMSADWDTLVILDGCRYDLFEPIHERFIDDQSYDLRAVTSMGSSSREFIQRNFIDEIYEDTVYITANPFVGQKEEGMFHAVENLFVTEWDEDLNTVPPGAVTEATVAAHEEFPNKRLVVHYMQPHYPFIGERGRALDHRGLYPEDSVTTGRDETTDPDVGDVPTRIWFRLKNGDIDRETVWDLYSENLDIVVPHVRDLLGSVDGKTVITSDHGNLLGERVWPIPIREYGHPGYVHVSELLTVPWLEIRSPGERRRVTGDPPPTSRSSDDINDDIVGGRLEHLGYRA